MEADPHPLVIYAENHSLSRSQAAAVFGIPYGTFRQIVSGHAGIAFGRAERWEKASGGEVKAIDVMRWQERNRKSTRGAAA